MLYASKQSLDAGFQEILDRDSSTGLTLWVFVERSLNQFHLAGAYTEAYVINEVYLRAVKFIDHGGVIDNLIVWCRATAYNYIRELNRRHQRERSYDNNAAILAQVQFQSGFISDDVTNEEYEIIRRAFAQLNPDDQQLINLHVINNLSWREIHLCLVAQGQTNRSETALRKAKERAIRRLRESYHDIKLPTQN
jgi:DNA-directed RNA polymerase specialized sigma24 family protein